MMTNHDDWLADIKQHISAGGALLFGNRPTTKVPTEISYQTNWQKVPLESNTEIDELKLKKRAAWAVLSQPLPQSVADAFDQA